MYVPRENKMGINARNRIISSYTWTKVSPLTVSGVQDDSQVLLPTISGRVKGSNSEVVEANIIYDSGAQIIYNTAIMSKSKK